MEERTKRINQAFRWLVWLEQVDNKNEFAEKLGLQRSNVTNVMNGKVAVSDNFIRTVDRSFPNIFNKEWLFDGEGEMLVNEQKTNTANPTKETNDQPSTIANLSDVVKEVERELADIRTIRTELQQHQKLVIQRELEREKKYEERMSKIAELAKRLDLFAGVGNIPPGVLDAYVDKKVTPK